MNEISEKTWRAYIERLRKINNAAAEKVTEWLNVYGVMEGGKISPLWSVDIYDRNLIDYCYYVVQEYGTASAAMSGAMYEALADLEGVTVPAAMLAENADVGEVAKTINGVLKHSNNPEELSSAVGRLVKRAGADTTLINAERDGAQFAWIPMGDTCAFCITLASRGWQNISKRALKNGHAEHIHSNCDCNYCVRFNESTTVEGYDPDAYYEMYENAEGYTPKEKINAMRREFYAENREEINAQKRMAYQKRKELNSSEATETNID